MLVLPARVPGDVRVHYARTDEIDCDADLLDRGERARALAFRFEADRRRYVAAHLLLRLALADRLRVPTSEVRFERQRGVGAARSKPRLTRALRSRLDLRFSLSHGGDHLLVATAHREVGVDVEPPIRPEAAAAVVTALHRRESAEIAALPPAQQPAAVCLVWVRKESLLKAVGTGLSRTPDLDYVGCRDTPSQPLPGWTTVDLPLGSGVFGALTWAH